MLDRIISESKWSESHGANNCFLGMGAIYYGIAYALKSKKCLCLGSGGGFVPKIMIEAQKRLIEEKIINKVNVTLVDADIGIWGRPNYKDEIPNYPEINLIKEKTDDVFHLFNNIDYLHIDADHTYDQVYKDLNNYIKAMNKKYWIITVHDTYNIGAHKTNMPIGCYKAVLDWVHKFGHSIINWPIGAGTAIISPTIGL
jgi:hypothetical protein